MRINRGIGGVLALTCASSAFAIDIVVNPGPTLSSNSAALAALERAAVQWESRLSDPITITLNSDFGSMPSGTAQAASVRVLRTYNNVRSLMITDAADEGLDDLIVGSLPTYDAFAAMAMVPPGSALNGGAVPTKANLKALGVTGLDAQFGVSDGSITFNTAVAFDFDNSDGVGANRKDFESAAMHEIGHALGFGSVVGITGDILPTTLDLFRFQDGAPDIDPTTQTFGTTPRLLAEGGLPIFDDGVNEWALSAGTDGLQPSHWRDDAITGTYLGIMDPTLPTGQIEWITTADLRVMDLIGYEVTTAPEPASVVALALCAVGISRRRVGKSLSIAE